MLGQPGGFRRRLEELVARFREKGATSPEKAMSLQELGLPPRFEEAMRGRLGASGIFVETEGKYYLNEARLQQIEQRREGPMGTERQQFRKNMLELRMARMAVAVVGISLVVANILFLRSLDVSLVIAALFILWIVLTMVQLSRLSIARRAMTRTQGSP